MGYELNRIMKQYGVNTPTMSSYTGAAKPGDAPTAPTEVLKPVAPTAVGAKPVLANFTDKMDFDAALAKYNADTAQYKTDKSAYDTAVKNYGANTQKYTTDLATYNKDKAAYDELMNKYNTENTAYKGYTTDYQNRLQNTPMYLQSQFDTGNRPVSAGVTAATAEGGMGIDKYNQTINDWLNQNKTASTADIRAQQAKGGVSNQDVYNATGSYWGNSLNAPTFTTTPTATAGATNTATGNVATQGPSGQTLYNFNGTPMYQMDTPTGKQWTTFSGNVGDVSTLPTYSDPYAWTDSYAHGGRVKTHYQTAGAVTLPSGYSDSENETEWMNRWANQQVPVEVNPVNMDTPPPPTTIDLVAAPVTEVVAPKSVLTDIAVSNAKAASEPTVIPPILVSDKQVTPAVAKQPVPFGDERMANIQALLSAYGPKDDVYGPELKLARDRAKKESDAFSNMLKTAMSSPENEQASKAEMYFRLAAAFGSPTKTGHFAENLGMVGKELGEYAKGKRESNKEKLALALKGQELRMGAAKEDLATLRSLSSEEMKDKRAIATELIKDYIKSGEPQSAAGKQAVDEGLKPGSEAYQKRVAAIGNMNVEGKMAQINATLANLSIAQANLALRQNQAAKLSPTEITMKREVEDTVSTTDQSLKDLKQAYALNPNSLAGGWMDKSQQWLSEAAGSKDPVVVNTRILNNLLGAQGLAKLKSTFGGNPTEGERAILMELEGIGSKTKEERAAVIRRTYKVLQEKRARDQRRLDDINSGAYRMTSPLEGGSE